jgi:hypothetical protein
METFGLLGAAVVFFSVGLALVLKILGLKQVVQF